MSSSQPANNTTFRGIFFLVIGIALFLNTILPTQYLSTLIITIGALLMIAYGMVQLDLHVSLLKFIRSILPHDKK